MPIGQYQALNASGAPQQGEIEAVNIEEARELLEQQGLTVQELESRDSSDTHAATSEETVTHLPLRVSFRLFSEEATTNQLRNSFKEMSRQLEAGAPIEQVLDQHEQQIPAHFLELLKIGANRGNLSTLLGQFSQHARQHADLKRSFWISIAYPALLLLATISIFCFFMLNLIPQFRKIFMDFGTELPEITRLVAGTSNFLVNYLAWMVGVGAVLLGILITISIVLKRVDRRSFESYSSSIPIIGRIRLYSAYSFYCRLLAMLIENNVPLTTAMELSGNATDNGTIIAQTNSLRNQILQGMNYGQLLPGLKSMPAEVRQAFRWLEDEKSMARLLRSTAKSLSVRADLNANLLRLFIEPIIMVGITLLLGSMVIALFMPLIKLLNDLS